MTTSYAWSSSYEVGHEPVDSQHRQLVELADLVLRAVHEQRGDEVVEMLGRSFAALERYAQAHFAEEEALLEELGSPLLEEHRRLHAQIMREATALHEEIVRGTAGDLPKLVRAWMLDRVLTHIVRDDRAAFEAAAEPPGTGAG